MTTHIYKDQVPLFSKEGLGEIWQKMNYAHTKIYNRNQISPCPSLSKEGGRLSGYLLFAIISLFLTACTTRLPELVFPEQLNFQGKTYQKVTDNRLDEMRQSLYLASDSEKNPEDWQQGFLLFSDQNSARQTLEQRVAFRKETAVNLPETYIAYQVEQNELRSQAIYPPTERFPNVQLEATRGRNLSCGYGQMQFAQKKPFALFCPDLTPCYRDDLNKLVNEFNQLVWQMECR